jgi:transposase-like protein
MTLKMNRSELFELLGDVLSGTDKGDLLAMLRRMLDLVMEAEVSEACAAGYGERTEERLNRRNGYRIRPFETRLGTAELAIPKLREGSYLPRFLEPRRRWEKAFVNVVAMAYVEGVSTRAMEHLVEAMGATGMSKSEVSRMAQVLDDELRVFRSRQMEKAFPYVWLDALYVKVRTGGRSQSRAVLIAIGVNGDGEREVIGVDIARTELESSWRAFLSGLVERNLHGVQLVVSDAHEGLRRAIPAVFNGVTWQRCYVHFIRNVLDQVGKTAAPLVAGTLRNIFQQTSAEQAKEALGKAVDLLTEKYPRAAEMLVEAEDEVLAYFAFPAAHWRQIRSTNPLERLNKELRRRIRAVGLFPNEDSAVRLVAAILAEQDDEWRTAERRYFSTQSMNQLLGRPEPAPALLSGAAAA